MLENFSQFLVNNCSFGLLFVQSWLKFQDSPTWNEKRRAKKNVYSRIFIPLDGDEESGDSITAKFSKHVACESTAARQLLSRADVDEHATRATFAFFAARQPPPISPQPLTNPASLLPFLWFLSSRKCRGIGNPNRIRYSNHYWPSLITWNWWQKGEKKKCNVGGVRKFLTYQWMSTDSRFRD